MYLCLNKLESKVWKKNCPNFLYTLYKAGRKTVIIFLFILGCFFSFVSNTTNFFIYSLNRFVLKKCLHVAGFLHLGDLYVNIRHDLRSEYNWQKNERSEGQRSSGIKCAPPSFDSAGGLNLLQNFQKRGGGLTGPSFFKGVAGKEGVTFFRGGAMFR